MKYIGLLVVAVAIAACAQGVTTPGTQSSTTSQGPGPTTASGTGGGSSLCAMDCSTIETPQCLKSVCNDGQYQGTIGECVIAPADSGTPCEDALFCTTDDTCDGAGQCKGGPENDCGITPDACKEVSCDEGAQSCTQIGSMNGAPCQDPNNLCLKGSTCNGGACIGGMVDDCFFFPVPDDCHVAVCNPANGMCEAQAGNEGAICTDPNDLCTVSKTCAAGVCQGGQPKDCSQLTQGCVLGVCNPANGSCFAQNLMNGDPCDDLNGCTAGEICQNGMCSGGTLTTTCTNNDGCCPPSCNMSTDNDCNVCSTVPGLSVFTQSINGWPDAGMQFTSQVTGTLESFTFNHQGLADTITFRNASNQVIGTFSVPASTPGALNVNISWPVQNGVTYWLTSAQSANGRWDYFSTYPVSGLNITVDGVIDQGLQLQTSWWFTFTNIEVCGS